MDLIDRESLLNQINSYCEANCIYTQEERDKMNRTMCRACTVGDILEMVENATSQNKWIPVSEELPKEFEDVICSTNKSEIFIATYLEKMNDGTDCFDDNDGMMWEGDIIAWQPLPEPYRESD